MPEVVQFMRAARYMGVAPWELARQPLAWMQWALLADEVDQITRAGLRVF